MSARSLLEGLAGAGGVVIGDEGGRFVEAAGTTAEPKSLVSVATAIFHELGQLGSALGLGACELFTIKGPATARVVGRQRGAIAVVETDPKRSTTEIEARLRRGDWVPAIERKVEPPAPPPPPGQAVPVPVAVSISAAIPDGAVPEPISSVGDVRTPVFAGDLQLFSLPDLLEFLRASQRTGTLVCSSGDGAGVVYLRRGKVVGASSPRAPTISTYFAQRGLFSESELRTLIAHPDDFSDAVIARVLIDRGLALPNEVRDALIHATQTAIRELVTWEHGRFAFDPAAAMDAPVPGVDLEIDSQSILLSIFTDQDERSRVH
jgi:hypothetical protein